MADDELQNGEEDIDASGRNATQQRIDEEGASDAPVDEDWDGD
jgi:hypothetical protein